MRNWTLFSLFCERIVPRLCWLCWLVLRTLPLCWFLSLLLWMMIWWWLWRLSWKCAGLIVVFLLFKVEEFIRLRESDIESLDLMIDSFPLIKLERRRGEQSESECERSVQTYKNNKIFKNIIQFFLRYHIPTPTPTASASRENSTPTDRSIESFRERSRERSSEWSIGGSVEIRRRGTELTNSLLNIL